MSRTVISSRDMLLTVGSLALYVVSSAGAQESLDKDKTGAQLYASNCAACHKSPQSVTKATGGLELENFPREHYPATPEAAATIAAYLKGLEKRSAGSTRGRVAKRMSQAKPPEQPPSESKEGESPVQWTLKRLLQAIKPENN